MWEPWPRRAGPQGGEMAGSSSSSSRGKESARCWCLRRRGMVSEWLLLESNTEVTIGRGLGLTYQLLSKQCPLMISRTHCIFRQNEEGNWTVTDNNSLNGVYLNHERLETSKAYQIVEGDHIQLGVPLKAGERAEYEYELIRDERENIEHFLTDQLKGKMKGQRTKRKYSACELDAFAAEGSSNSRSKSLRLSWDGEEQSKSSHRAVLVTQPTEKIEPKLPVAGPSTLNLSQPDCSTQCFEKDELFSTQPVEKAVSCDKGTKSVIAAELGRVREKMLEIRKLKMMVQEKQTKVLSIKQQSKKRAQKQVWEMEGQLQELHDQLHSVQEEQLQRIKELEKTFYEEEQQLEGDQSSERDESLREHLAQALQELTTKGQPRVLYRKDLCSYFCVWILTEEVEHTILMEELDRSKKDFEHIIQAKNKELQETMEEKEKVQAQKEEVLNQMNNVLDNEMQCIICSEHFIEAVTLNCAHSFCSYCIKEWIKRKVECPICRQEIITQTRSLVLDNCIDRMMENLSHEIKEHRLALIKERKEIKEKPEAAVSPAKSDTGSSGSNRRHSSSSSILSSMASIMSISSYDSDDFYEENFDFEGFDDYDYDGYEGSENDDDNYFIL